MAKTNKTQPTAARFSPFSGIDTRQTHSGSPSSADIVNFRVLPDGSLEKREGISRRFSLSSSCRAVWTGILDGKKRTYLLCGAILYALFEENQVLNTLGRIETSSGDADFFYYRDVLYLCDGRKIYQISDSTPKQISAYVPLIGKDWPTATIGEPFEPRNHATRRVRISYLIEEEFIPLLRTAGPIHTIDGVWKNDTRLSEEDYFYDAVTECVSIPSLQAGDRVVIALTYFLGTEADTNNRFFTCTRADIFGGNHNGCVLLWNGKDKSTFFPSKEVTTEMLSDSKRYYSDSGQLYFPQYAEVTLGDGRYPITGVCRHYDRLLIFTEGATYKANLGEGDTPILSLSEINPYFGCATPDAISHCQNDPITVGSHAILRWNSETDEHNECNAREISAPIASLLPDGFFSNAIVYENRKKRELWFHMRGGEDTVWIYGIDSGAWYRFTGIRADCFFEWEGKLGFCYQKSLFFMDPMCYSDDTADGSIIPIHAYFMSGVLEYGTEQKKHATALSLRSDHTGTVSVMLLPDQGLPLTASFSSSSESNPHTLLTKRICSGRFRYATLTLSSEDGNRPTIHSLVSLVR